MTRIVKKLDARGCGKELFHICDPGERYSFDQVVDILQRAADAGYPMGQNSPLEHLTVRELDNLLKFGGS